jgi:hypothetical protein
MRTVILSACVKHCSCGTPDLYSDFIKLMTVKLDSYAQVVPNILRKYLPNLMRE